jgi:hypothetical protein
MRAATCSKTANPICMRDFARFTFRNDEIFARHRSPCDIRRAGASPAIDAMTIDQRKRPTLQHVSGAAANASASEVHRIRLAHFNHESTLLRKATARQARMNTRSSADSELYSLSSLDEFNGRSTLWLAQMQNPSLKDSTT